MDERTIIADLERRLAESEARHRLLSASWAQAEWETDAAGVVITDSPSWRAYTGQTREEWLEHGWLDAIHPEDRDYAERQWREAIAARGLVNAEFRLRAADGGWRWTNVRAAPVLKADGSLNKWVGMNIDIDARKRAEAALRESEEKYRSLFGSMDEAFAVVEVLKDAAGKWVEFRFLDANRAFMEHTSMPRPVGMTATELLGSPNPRWVELYGQVLDSGVPMRVEETERTLGRTFDLNIFALDRARHQVAVLFTDVTARKHADLLMRENQDRQAFLLKLSDALRAEPDGDAVAYRALQMLIDHLDLDRCYITYYRPTENEAVFPYQLGNDTVPPLPAKVRLSDFPDAYEQVLDRTFVIEDDFERRGLSEAERANSKALGMRAMLASTIRKGEGSPLASMAAVSSRPRQWSPAEIALVEEAAERTWAAIERMRAEAALRESEERFRQFAHAAAEGAWIRNAETLDMEYVSPAASRIYGVEPKALFEGVHHWAGLILPEDRNAALALLEEARRGKVVVHEFRIQRPLDGAFRWIKSTDFPLMDGQGNVQRIGGLAEDVTEAKLAVEHQGVLLAELQHRVRNIMGVIRSMANRTADGARDVADYRVVLEGRLLALARVQTLLTREANAGGSLREILESEIGAQAHGRGQYALTGQDVRLSPKAVEVLTLAFHELATNALKYGALSVPEGYLTVTWEPFERRGSAWMAVEWIEHGAPRREPARRRGFGSELIEARIPYELGGRGTLVIEPQGARCRLEFPLREAESILETDAPQPTTTFGGSLDMTGAPDLTGRTILVVEDDYYLATDTAAALRRAGAKVLGPCPTEDATRNLLADETPTHAILDLNLGGGGPRFEIAQWLKAEGVPFVFLTGYDPDVIPADLADIVRLQKPLPFRDIVEAISQLS